MIAAVLFLAQCTETESAVLLGLRHLARHQNADGSWGVAPRTHSGGWTTDEATHTRVRKILERLEHDNIDVREAAQADLAALGSAALPSLRWALRSPDPEVRARIEAVIGDESGEEELTALAVLAFVCAGHTTADREFGEVLRKGRTWLVRRGASGPIADLALDRRPARPRISDDPRTRAWQVLHLYRRGTPSMTIQRDEITELFLDPSSERFARLDYSELDAERLCLSTAALYLATDPKDANRSAWGRQMKTTLLRSQDVTKEPSRGSWGDLRTTAWNTLTLEVYYRYANSLGERP